MVMSVFRRDIIGFIEIDVVNIDWTLECISEWKCNGLEISILAKSLNIS